MQSWAPKLNEHLDYRVFLGEYDKAAKENLPAFSYRYFSQKAGYRSPVFLKLVIDGQRNLSGRGLATASPKARASLARALPPVSLQRSWHQIPPLAW